MPTATIATAKIINAKAKNTLLFFFGGTGGSCGLSSFLFSLFSVYLEGDAIADSGIAQSHENLDSHKFLPKELHDAVVEKYRHPVQKELMEYAKKVGGHGGMDFIMDYRLIYCLRNGLPLDQDVYDAAEWSCIGELSRASLENKFMAVEVPDFTRGEWKKLDGQKFSFAE